MSVVPRAVMRLVVRRAVRPVLRPTVPVHRQRRLLDFLGRPSVLPRGTIVVGGALGGRRVERISLPGADAGGAVLYLHGGGYTVGSTTTHRPLAAHLAAAAGVPVQLLDYRLAPEHPFPAGLDDAVTAYADLLASGIGADRITIAGDSAGGGLTLALAQRLREEDLPLPTALGLISPWVDLSLCGVKDDPRDPLLTVAWLRSCAARYAGQHDPGQPLLSPLNADLTGLPPTIVHASSEEILRPGIERLVARLDESGVPVTYRCLPRMWHVAHLQAGLFDQATEAVREIGRFLAVSKGTPART